MARVVWRVFLERCEDANGSEKGDLVIVQPWDFQDSRADVRMRYTKTQSIYLSRKGVLPEIVDLFGMTDDQIHEQDEDYEIVESVAAEEDTTTEVEQEVEQTDEEVVEEPKSSSLLTMTMMISIHSSGEDYGKSRLGRY